MNCMERVRKCIRFEHTDTVPYQINYTSVLGSALMNSLGLEERKCEVRGKNIYRYNSLDDYLGNHLAFIRNRAVDSYVEVKPGFFRDEWGVVWDRTIDRDIGTPANCVLAGGDLEDLNQPDPDAGERFAHFDPLIEANGHRYIIAKFSYSLFERAWSLRGMENLMVDFIQNPDFVRELFGAITRYNLALMDNMSRYPIHGIYFGDDWGSQRGMLMSPELWRAFVGPCIERMYGAAHDRGWDVFIHSCGDITAVLDDLIDLGLNVFNPFQPEVMNVQDVIGKYAGRLAFYGGLSIQRTLPFGTRNEVREETEHRLALARKHSGFIVSPSHDMPPDIPLENILEMRDVLKG